MTTFNNKAETKGKTIGLITPSSPVSQQVIDNSIAYFANNGFKVKVGKHCHRSSLMTAGTDRERAEDIMTFFKDQDISALVVTRGGVGSITTLPFLDFDLIKNNPKPIIGFSDTTALQLGVHSKTNLISFTGFSGSDVDKDNKLDNMIKTTLTKCLNKENYSIESGNTVHPGSVSGPLMGGNLMSFLNLMGTPFEPEFAGKILFFEDVSLEPYIIEGMMAQLHVSGILNKVAGVIVGTFIDCEANRFPNQQTTDNIINDWCKTIKVPCINHFAYGHMSSRAVLPIGQVATLDATHCKLDIVFDG